MRAKQLAERRDRNRELAKLDAERRCAVCKLDLAQAPEIVEDFLVRGKCCSDACLETLLVRAKAAGR